MPHICAILVPASHQWPLYGVLGCSQLGSVEPGTCGAGSGDVSSNSLETTCAGDDLIAQGIWLHAVRAPWV